MDVHAGVAAMQAGDLDALSRSALCANASDLAAHGAVHAAGATDAEIADRFRIEVQEILGLEHAGGELGSAGEAGFFVDRKYKFQRAVGDIGAFHHRQSGGDADTVVSAESGTVGLQPVAIADHLDGISFEIVSSVFVLLTDHVEVALEERHGSALSSGAGRLADDQVA